MTFELHPDSDTPWAHWSDDDIVTLAIRRGLGRYPIAFLPLMSANQKFNTVEIDFRKRPPAVRRFFQSINGKADWVVLSSNEMVPDEYGIGRGR